MSDKLSKALNLDPMSLSRQIKVAVDDVTRDVDQAKHNLKDLILKGSNSLDELLSVASASEQPRAYEVAATFIKTLVDANRELADLNFKDQSINKEVYEDKRQIHNHVYVGSSADLLKMLKGDKNEDDDDKVIDGW